jgi:hypothetical protein
LGGDIGCPAAVANLWDVTDRDVDRFSRTMLATWGIYDELPDAAGLIKDPSGESGDQEVGPGGPDAVCLASSVTRGRSACRLPHLIGAAPVCYGIPVCISGLGHERERERHYICPATSGMVAQPHHKGEGACVR